MISKEKYRDKTIVIIFFCMVLAGNVMYIGLPFVFSRSHEGVLTIDVAFFGYGLGSYREYDNADYENQFEFHGYMDSNYNILIAIFGLLGVIPSSIAIFFTGKNKKKSFLRQRIAGIILTISGILGFISTILFIGYFRVFPFANPHYSVGFYAAIIYFPILVIIGIYHTFISHQLPIPEKTPAPKQRGTLIPEERKQQKRRKLFQYIETIDKEVSDGEVN